MTSHPEIFEAWSFAAIARAVVAVCALGLAAPAPAQDLRPPGDIPSQQPGESAANPSAAPAPDSVFQPGVVDTIGHWLNEGTTRFKTDLQGTQATFDQFAKETRDVAKDAADAVMGLPNARIVTVRERCAAAQNGAPDCQAAAAAACRGKGFQAGKTVDTQSEHKCPAQVLLKGRAPNAAECSTEIFVTRAVCQ
jgi:hypothetical protein